LHTSQKNAKNLFIFEADHSNPKNLRPQIQKYV